MIHIIPNQKIDATLNLYSPTAQILNDFSKLYIDNTFLSSAQTGTLYYNKAETDNMLLSYSTGSYVDYTFYTKTDTLLAGNMTNTGDIELPGWLDIGTSGYTNSRIRCDADVNGYTGYAELKAATSYDMFLNLNTTYPNGGWMYFKINNDDYMQLSGSDNEVNTYKDTAISGNLDVGQSQAQTSIKTYVNHIGKTGHVEMETRWANQGFIHFKTNHASGEVFFAVKDPLRDEIYMYVGNDIVHIYEDTTIGGNLDAGTSQAQTSSKACFNHAGNTGHIRIEGRYRDQGYLHFETNYQYGDMFLTVRNTLFIRCSDYAGNPYVQTFQPLKQSPDDR